MIQRHPLCPDEYLQTKPRMAWLTGLDMLTSAQLSGTSVAMIERHYGHLRADHAALALASLAL